MNESHINGGKGRKGRTGEIKMKNDFAIYVSQNGYRFFIDSYEIRCLASSAVTRARPVCVASRWRSPIQNASNKKAQEEGKGKEEFLSC